MIHRLTNILIWTTLSLSMAFCQTNYNKKLQSIYQYTVPLIQSDSLKSLIRSEPSLVLLDIRSRKEFDVSHIEGARFLDYEHFDPKMIRDIPKNAPLVVYCSVGYRSERIGKKLLDMGYKKVDNLYGGIFEWKNEGNEVVNIEGLPTDSVHTYNKSWSKWLKKGVKVY